MIIIPFVCLAIGIVLGLVIKSKKFAIATEGVSTVALIFLMLSIGIGIGMDESIVNNFVSIGINCAVIAVCAIVFSVIFTVICEKTLLPLGKLDKEMENRKIDMTMVSGEKIPSEAEEKKKGSHLVWIMPVSVILGLIIGIIFRKVLIPGVVDNFFTASLILLYLCVGVSQGANKEVFHFIKVLGLKVLWLPLAILIGSLTGGLIAGLLLNVPMEASLVSSGGMSFYSITGAYMTDAYGLEIGTYGFIVNIMREFLTILFMPILIKISKGSPIAGGAAGNMDTMLAPVTKFVGVRLGLVTLITGTILTFTVPFLLPLLSSII